MTINGSCYDSNVSIKISITTALNFTMATSTEMALSIGLMNVIIGETGNLTLSQSSFNFLPNSFMRIKSGGILNLKQNVHLSFLTVSEGVQMFEKSPNPYMRSASGYSDAYMINNGTINTCFSFWNFESKII